MPTPEPATSATRSRNDFTIEFPVEWEQQDRLLGTLIVALAPTDHDFRPNYNVIVAPRDARTDDDTLRQHGADALGGLESPVLLDSRLTHVGGRMASHILVTHRFGDRELTLVQWLVPFDGRSLVFSATTETADFATLAESFDAITASVVFDE